MPIPITKHISFKYIKIKIKKYCFRKLIKIDKWFPCSKTCSCCGAVKKELELSERTYRCENCGCIREVPTSKVVGACHFIQGIVGFKNRQAAEERKIKLNIICKAEGAL